MPKRKKTAEAGGSDVPAPGAVTKCGRCARPLRVAERRREDSAPFRLSKTKEGVCPDCVVTEFLYNTYPPNMIIDEAGPEMLLKPGIGQAFVSSGLLDHCDLTIEEIDWQRVVDNWNLPVKIQKSALNPYRMGESPRARSRGRDLAPAGDLPPLGFHRGAFGSLVGSGSFTVVRDSAGNMTIDGKPLSESYDVDSVVAFGDLFEALGKDRKKDGTE